MAKKQDMLIFKIEFDEIISCTLWFVLGNDIEAVVKFAHSKGYADVTQETFANMSGTFIGRFNDPFPPIVLAANIPYNTRDHCVVLHEISHFVDWVCRYWNIPLDKNNEEFRALLLEQTARRYFDNVLKLRKKR
jgi:hypothetical protein